MTLRAPLTALALVAAVPLVAPTLSQTADDAGLPGLATALDAGTADAAFIRRGFIKKKGALGNYRTTVVVRGDKNGPADEVADVEVAIEASPGAPSPVSGLLTGASVQSTNGNQVRFVFNGVEFGDDAVGHTYTMTTTLLGADGLAIGTPDVRTVEVGGDGDPKLQDARLLQLDATNFRLQATVVNDSEQEVAGVSATFVDFEGPEPIPAEMVLPVEGRSGGRATFAYDTLTFDDPTWVAWEAYTVTLELLGTDGGTLATYERELMVDASVFQGTCFDGIQNGAETGVDCGGTSCAACPTGVELSTTNTIEYLNQVAQQHEVFLSDIDGAFAVPGTEALAFSSLGGYVVTAELSNGGVVVIPEGTFTIGGSFAALDPLSTDVDFFVADFPQGSEVLQMKVYSGGAIVAEEVVPAALCGAPQDDDFLRAATIPGFGGVEIQFMYGDIIMPSMPLDDFND